MTGTSWADLMKNAQVASQPVSEGEHPVRITDAQATQTSNGKPMIKITAEILEGADAKRKVYGNQVLSEENGTALAIFFRTMTAIGLDENFFAQEPNMGDVARNMIGRQARVIIKHREWNGQVRGDIDRWVPALGGGGGLPVAGPIAPGTVVGPAGPPLPTSNSSPSTGPSVGAGPTVGAGPVAPTDAPPPLPI